MSGYKKWKINRTYNAISRESGRLSGSENDSGSKEAIYDVEGVKPVRGSRLIGVIVDDASWGRAVKALSSAANHDYSNIRVTYPI